MLPNWAVDDDRLSGYDLLVYMALIRHADNTGVCWPSLERLGDDTKRRLRLARLGAAGEDRALLATHGIQEPQRA
jgi:hypothetical protein